MKRKWPILQQRILNKLFFDYSLKFVNEAFLIILVGVTLNTFYFKWNTFGNTLNSIPCTFGTFLILAHLITLAIIFSRKKFVELVKSSDERFRARFGSMYSNINIMRPEIGPKALHFNLLNNVRKLVFVSTLIYFQRWPNLSIICNIY